MKKASIRLLSVFVVLVLLSSLTLVVMGTDVGSTANKNGLQAQLYTDKTSYTTGEEVDARVQINNGTGKDVSAAVFFHVPQGLKLSGKASTASVDLKAGESYTTSDEKVASAGNNVLLIVLLILEVLIAAGAVFLLVTCNKKYKAALSALLVVALVGGMGAMAVPAQAADWTEQLQLSCPIQIDGKEAAVTATVVFTIHEEANSDTTDSSTDGTGSTDSTTGTPDPNVPPSLEIQGTVLYTNDYSAMDGWTLDAGATATDSYAKINEAGQLEIHAGTETAAGVTRPLDNYSGKVAFEFLFTPTFNDSRDAGGIMATIYGATDSGNTAGAISVYAYSYGFAYYDKNREGGAGVVAVGSCAAGQTYRVQILADTGTDTYDFYVDGELLAEDIAFRTGCNKFNKIMHSTTGAATGITLKWDNLVITNMGETSDDKPNSDPNSNPNLEPDPYEGLATTEIYKDTFDDIGNWTTMTSNTSADAATNYVKVNNGKLEIKDDHNCRMSAVLKLKDEKDEDLNLTGLLGFEFDVTASELLTDSGVYFTIWGNSSAGDDKLAMDVRIFADRLDCYTTQFNPVEGSYEANKTYRVKLVADVAANTYSVIIDGKLIVADIEMRNGTISCLNKIRFWSPSDALAATVTYDNLVIYQITK